MFFNTLKKAKDSKVNPETVKETIVKNIAANGDISLGSDIEVLWFSKGVSFSGNFNTEFFSAERIFCKNGIFGTDGRASQGELRISPVYDVSLIEDTTRTVLEMCLSYIGYRQDNDSVSNIPNIYPYGLGAYEIMKRHKSMYESIGLHIHFGNSFICSSTTIKTKLISFLDLLLLPVIKRFESPFAHHVRATCGFYGNPSDYEDKPYGVEYKSLPSCIDNKDVYLGAFAVAKAIAHEVLANNINYTDLTDVVLHENKLGDKEYLKTLTKFAYKFIQYKCSFYYLYKEYIDKLFEMALEDKPYETYFSTFEDVFSYWGIEFISDGYYDVFKGNQIIAPVVSPVQGYKHKDLRKMVSTVKDTEYRRFIRIVNVNHVF